MRDLKAIWQAKEYKTVLRRYLQVCRQYRDSQPEAVATLHRDFRATLTYYGIEQQHPTWQRRFLRTTSHLERFNRALRKRCRSAGAYHSDEGILAMVAQTADEAFQPASGPERAKRHTIPTALGTLPIFHLWTYLVPVTAPNVERTYATWQSPRVYHPAGTYPDNSIRSNFGTVEPRARGRLRSARSSFVGASAYSETRTGNPLSNRKL